jgi:chemotaxis protein MotB
MSRVVISLRTFCLAALLLLCAVGCQSNLQKDNDELRRQNLELQNSLNDANTKLHNAADPSQLAQLQAEIDARDAKIKQLESSLRTPTPGAGAQPGIEGIETSYDPKAGTLTVNLPGDVLFTSGQADLKASSLATLDKVVRALKKDYAGKKIRVDGYTDSDPVVRTKAKWTDNLGLSLARAAAVTRYLESKGVPASNIVTAGYGAAHPKASKPRSRRVEIVVQVR